MKKAISFLLYIAIIPVVILLVLSVYMALDYSEISNRKRPGYTADEICPAATATETAETAESAAPAETETTAMPAEPPDKIVDITFNFMGDCTLGTYRGEFTERRFNETAERVEPEYFFKGVKKILDDGTFNITNCEGVFTDSPLTEVYKDYDPAFWFKSPAKNARIFSMNNICGVGISNNHIGDYGYEGIEDTKSALEEYNVKWSDTYNPLLLEKDGIKTVVFCVSLWDAEVPYDICSEIEEYSETTDLQIVFFHGGTENIHEPDSNKIEYSHKFVDAGADLVIGSHPHVLQPLEVYNGVNIIYSLGNFIYGGNTRPENRTIVYQHKFSFKNDKLTDSKENIYPCYIFTGDMNEFQPVLIEDKENKQQVLDFMYGEASSPL